MAFPATNDYMQSEGNSRKRVRISRDNEPRNAMEFANSSATVQAVSSSVTPTADSTHSHGAPCLFEQSLANVQTDLEAMRGLITCQICHRFMYEPYSLQCGHTYCYSCVSSWFKGKTKKNCPECRSVIDQTPTPSYIIKEMVLIFSGRNLLLPDGETSEEHINFANEEAEIVARDKADPDPRTGGLFKGIFRPGHTLQAIRDISDNVYRCPNCLHEVEDGWCNQCGEPVEDERGEGFSEYDTDDDLDGDLEDMDGNSDFGTVDGQHDAIELLGNGQILIRHARQRGTHSPVEVSSHTSDDDESDSELDEDETEFNSFIVPDDTNIYDDSASDHGLPDSEDFEPDSESIQQATSRHNRRARQTVVLSSDDEDAAPAQGSRSRVNRQVVNIDDEEEDELPAPIANRRGRTGLRQQNSIEASASSDGSDDGSERYGSIDSDGSDSEEAETIDPHLVPQFDFHRRSRANQMYRTDGSDQDSMEDDENDMHTDDLVGGVDFDDDQEEADDDDEGSDENSAGGDY
ncbi:Hypothetical protein R9X50_00651700 [Acrodontium crateriforme]|uniref:RING-type domain-containing protein n=1 Tax=Acrodontium crateriforme TaxID=150365 RepID=A0AAQ3M8G9_9PEZI|nr:Hypothetical protein R9X50_00651700 [Acrodontium crateriforme]